MILEMQAANLIESKFVQKVDEKPTKEKATVDAKVEEIKVDTKDLIEKSVRKTYEINDTHEKYESKISMLQTADKALAKDKEILNKMQDLVKSTDFEKLTREEKVDTMEKLIKYVDDINKISINTVFGNKNILDGSYVDSDTDNNRIEVNLDRVDSQTLGLSVDNISKLTLDSVRVAGENYMPPYTFDVTKPAGASTALSVIGTAISKIDSYRRQITINMSELTRYPECLELDRSEINAEQAKIRNAESARRIVAQLQNNIRAQIQEAQRSQIVKNSENVVRLFMNS